MKTAFTLGLSGAVVVSIAWAACGGQSDVGFGLVDGGVSAGAGGRAGAGTGGVIAAGGHAGGSAGTGGAIAAGGHAGTGGAVAAGGSAGAGGGTVYKPCAGKKCGDTCTTCQPGMACPAVIEYCNAAGKCAMAYPVCSSVDAGSTYSPCVGKVCGEACTLCAPNDLTCAETMIMKYCSAASVCTPTPGTCPTVRACKTLTDCPMTDICMTCANSAGCASMSCVKNQCTWQCP